MFTRDLTEKLEMQALARALARYWGEQPHDRVEAPRMWPPTLEDLLQRERLAIAMLDGQWCAFMPGVFPYSPEGGLIEVDQGDADGRGVTPLLAAMRAVVTVRMLLEFESLPLTGVEGARWLDDEDPDGYTDDEGHDWQFLRIRGVLHRRRAPPGP